MDLQRMVEQTTSMEASESSGRDRIDPSAFQVIQVVRSNR